eukprot:scaffold64771_cov32-Prasinocladus_malaysianus.AAC.1
MQPGNVASQSKNHKSFEDKRVKLSCFCPKEKRDCIDLKVGEAETSFIGLNEMNIPVQNDASAFLYISQMDWYLTGNMQKRSGFSASSGSSDSNSCERVMMLCVL